MQPGKTSDNTLLNTKTLILNYKQLQNAGKRVLLEQHNYCQRMSKSRNIPLAVLG